MSCSLGKTNPPALPISHLQLANYYSITPPTPLPPPLPRGKSLEPRESSWPAGHGSLATDHCSLTTGGGAAEKTGCETVKSTFPNQINHLCEKISQSHGFCASLNLRSKIGCKTNLNLGRNRYLHLLSCPLAPSLPYLRVVPFRTRISQNAEPRNLPQRAAFAQDLQFLALTPTIRIRNRPAKQVGDQRWLNQHSMNRGSTRQSVLCAVSASPECLINRGELHRLRTGSPAHYSRPSGSDSTSLFAALPLRLTA